LEIEDVPKSICTVEFAGGPEAGGEDRRFCAALTLAAARFAVEAAEF